jgi:hypothetical protein
VAAATRSLNQQARPTNPDELSVVGFMFFDIMMELAPVPAPLPTIGPALFAIFPQLAFVSFDLLDVPRDFGLAGAALDVAAQLLSVSSELPAIPANLLPILAQLFAILLQFLEVTLDFAIGGENPAAAD